MKTWITADWHLGETRLDIIGRPFASSEEHVNALIAEHNKLVAPEDTVIVVGDLCYQKTPEQLPNVARFNGKTKILVRGNHDRIFTDEQLRPYFEMILSDGKGFEQMCGGIKCYITHYPTQGRPDLFNLVGHIHTAWKYQLNMLNIGVDVHHFRPVDIERIPFHKTAVETYYDEDVWVAYSPLNASYKGVRGKKGSYFTPAT